MHRFALALVASLAMAGCALPPTGPVQVTRFVSQPAIERLGSGTIFVETAPGENGDEDALRTYKAAIARQLVALGYRETSRDQAGQVAQVRVSRTVIDAAASRGPVSVGVGGSTGTYGSGVGLGIGLNLGGGKAREQVSTRLEVRINDALTGQSLWEGRALFDVASTALLADSAQNASVMVEALFQEFPGNDGETVEVSVAK
ncbi:DUF4136 domain-containing protein [Erythrobacter sp. SDW2]|uniref:DUF4136 domain-containing protein n=1 Tax=Erythrobacter sp. SDW2 TaxID=2907154 RepID=UPI001F351A1A|nr:DUF4136 domain-containing protein [Erythrobacter sp. SDW2]UIP06844.1 DUF4136 domain-containing protein [Erythrobacter sp. SDW2]